MPYELTFTHRFDVPNDDSVYINDCCFAGDVITERLMPLVEGNYERIESC